MRYAMRRIVSFEDLRCVAGGAFVLEVTQDYMMHKIGQVVGFEVARDRVDTFVRPYPRDTGERGMAYDPLRIRQGIEIELITIEYETIKTTT